MDVQWRDDVEIVKQARVFFGHQSVGWNIIEGMMEAATGTSGLKIVSADSVRPGDGAYFAHAAIGRNGSPTTKCDAFLSEVDRLAGDSLQLAIMKFCFADFVPETDVNELFQYYIDCVDSLHSRHPHIRIVHMTAPLLRTTPVWKRIIKRALGRPENSEVQNLNVNKFNDLLIRRFKNEPIFDLARLESTSPDGSRCIVNEGPDRTYTLSQEFTSDGGHLNALGRRLAAIEMIHVLATALK